MRARWACPQFDSFDASVISTGGNNKAALDESIGVCGRESVVAPMEADERRIAAQSVHACAGNGGDISFFSHQAAGEPANHEIVPIGRSFGVLGICDPGDVSRKRYYRVLESAAGAQEWLARRSGRADR
jgi:hypothetical protein